MKATEELARKQGFHSWLILFHSKLQSKSDQKLTCAKFPRPCNHLVILMLLSAFMTRAKMTISLRSIRKHWLSGSGSRRLTKIWSPGSSLHPRPLGKPIRNPGTLHLALCSGLGKHSDQGHYEWNIWGSTKWNFHMKLLFFFSLPESIQPGLLPKAFTTKEKAK